MVAATFTFIALDVYNQPMSDPSTRVMSVRVPAPLAAELEAEAAARSQSPGRRIRSVLEERCIVADEERITIAAAAARLGLSESDVIRRALEALEREELEDDPIYGLVGIIDDDGPTDGSVNHDEYIYDDPHGKDKKNWPR